MQKIGVAGIVAEYNPFHCGHEWMIDELRRRGAHTVVCVMSGPFVQRGAPALLPTPIRARAAALGGADLVLRLPLPWATAGAERFAEGGVGLLAALGCVDTIAFGAETAETGLLWETAALLLSDAFPAELKKNLAGGISFAAARAAAAEALHPGAGAVLQSPNNILGVEYCKALEGHVRTAIDDLAAAGHKPLPDAPLPLALPRRGAAHDGPPQEGYASASWLRGRAWEQGIGELEGYVPAAALALYCEAGADGRVLAPDRWQLAALSRLRGKTTGDFAAFEAAGEGLEARLAEAARQAVTLDELYDAAKSKRFAHSRVRRLALQAALEIPTALPALPPFAQVLAAGSRGLALLRQAKLSALVPVSTSLAKLARTGPEAQSLAALEARAEDLHALCLQTPRPGGEAYTRPASFV